MVGARITTSLDAVAFDAFRVRWDATMDPAHWERVETTLRGVLSGSIDLERLVAQAVRPARRPPPSGLGLNER